jgi:NADP-dependent 3-hydroxy acid dehydrogenase YdfG
VRPSELNPELVDAYLPTALHTLMGVREFLPGMVQRGDGALLAAGGFSAVRGVPYFSAPGPALAAQRNYLQSLETELAGTGVFVGRLYVGATIANSAWHQRLQEQQAAGRPMRAGDALVDPAELADTLWTMHHESKQAEVVVPEALLAG